MNREYHKSVLLNECITALNIVSGGTYVDLTFGGGGHSREIIKHLGEDGRLFGFDQDADAMKNSWDDSRLKLIQSNFSEAADYLIALGIHEIDGVLADLGVSSFQLDNNASGFSFRSDVDLDMRMDKSGSLTAEHILNTYSRESLQMIFQNYGEVRNAKLLANNIVEARMVRPIRKSDDLNEILMPIKFGVFQNYAAPIYQALRMEVNQELAKLEEMLLTISKLVKVGGRIAVITFHSLEDRIVKNFMKYGECTDEPQKDIFGRTKEWKWKVVTKKPILPTENEIKSNARSRSAKLRIIERIG